MGSKGATEKNKFLGKFKFSYGLQSRFQATSVRPDSFLVCNNTETVSPSAKEIMVLTFFVHSCDIY